MQVLATIGRWSDWMSVSGMSENTRRQYRRAMMNFLADTGLEPEAVSEGDIVAYSASMHPQMRGQVVRAMRCFFRWLEGNDPTARIPIPRPKYSPAPTLTSEELDELFRAAEPVDPRARWTLQFIYATGARITAACSVLPADVQGGQVIFRFDKGGRARAVPIGPRAEEAIGHLLELINYTPKRGPRRKPTLIGVSPNRVRQWLDAAEDASGVKVWPHLLRHAFGTNLAADPAVDIRTWVALMGHADASQFTRYAHARQDALRKAVGKL